MESCPIKEKQISVKCLCDGRKKKNTANLGGIKHTGSKRVMAMHVFQIYGLIILHWSDKTSTTDRCARTHSSCCHFLIFRLRNNVLEPPNTWPSARIQCKSASAGSSEGFSSLHLSGSHPAKPSEESSCNYVQTERFSGLAHRRRCNKKGNGASNLFNTNQITIKQLYSCRQ